MTALRQNDGGKPKNQWREGSWLHKTHVDEDSQGTWSELNRACRSFVKDCWPHRKEIRDSMPRDMWLHSQLTNGRMNYLKHRQSALSLFYLWISQPESYTMEYKHAKIRDYRSCSIQYWWRRGDTGQLAEWHNSCNCMSATPLQLGAHCATTLRECPFALSNESQPGIARPGCRCSSALDRMYSPEGHR